MKRFVAGIATVAVLAGAAVAQGHTGGATFAAPNKSSWSCAEAKYILSARYFAWPSLEGQPVRLDCIRRINPGALVLRSYHLCSGYYCQSQGVHDCTLDWDPSKAGWSGPVFTVVCRHV